MMFYKKTKAKHFIFISSFSTALVALVIGCDGRRDTPATIAEGSRATFRVETVTATKETVSKLDQFGLVAGKKLQFTACVTDSAAQQPIKFTHFAISDGNSRIEKTTDATGCIIWEESHELSSLQKERTYHVQRSFVALEGFQGTVVVDLAINPWNMAAFADLRKESPPGVTPKAEPFSFDTSFQAMSVMAASDHPSDEAYLNHLELSFLGHDKTATKINSLLTLKPAQKFRLTMHPQFARLNLQGQPTYVDINNGSFKMTMVMLREDAGENPTLNDLVADYVGIVNVMPNGDVMKDILLRIHDTAAVLSRNKVMILLEPSSNATANTQVGIYSGYINPLNGVSVSVNLMSEKSPVQMKAEMNHLLREVHRPSISGRMALQHYSGLSPANPQFGARMLQGAAAKSQSHHSALSEVCKDLYKDIPSIQVEKKYWMMPPMNVQVTTASICEQNPQELVNLEAHDFVESIEGNPVHVDSTLGDDRVISLNHVTDFTQTQSTSKGNQFYLRGGWTGEAVAEVIGSVASPKLGGVLGADGHISGNVHATIGKDWYQVKSSSETQTQSVSANVSQADTLQVVSDSYEMNAIVRRCVITVSRHHNAKKGYFSCEGSTHKRRIHETYYLVNHSRPASPFSDSDSIANSQLRLTIRGDATYKSFEQMMSAKNIMLTRVNPQTPLLTDFRVSQVFPGMVSE